MLRYQLIEGLPRIILYLYFFSLVDVAGLIRKGLSQTLNRPHDRRELALFSGFVDLQETETDRQQPVLLAHRPWVKMELVVVYTRKCRHLRTTRGRTGALTG